MSRAPVAGITADMVSAMRRYIPHGDCYRLAGDHNSSARQAFMLALTGQKLPKAKCGITVIQQTVFALVQPAGDCLAARERNLEAFIAHYSTGAAVLAAGSL